MTVLRIAIPEIHQNVSNYVRALTDLGAKPVLITTHKEEDAPGAVSLADFRVEDYDGLILPGGGDIDPKLYGEQIQGSRGIRDDLDELQLAVLEAFIQAKKPVFGVCRGCQLINVAFGGSLVQDIPTSKTHSRGVPWSVKPDNVHAIDTSGWLCRLYGEHFCVNSAHHQSVKKAGEGICIDAVDPEDNVVEAIHHESLPIWAVQFHPERLCCSFAREDAVDGSIILKGFLDYIRRHLEGAKEEA